MSFSERMGLTERRETLQLNEMSKELRNAIWSGIYIIAGSDINSTGWKTIAKRIFLDFLKRPIDDIPHFSNDIWVLLKGKYMDYTLA